MRFLEIYKNKDNTYTFWVINDNNIVYPVQINYDTKEIMHKSIYEYSIKKTDVQQILKKMIYKNKADNSIKFYSIEEVIKNETNIYHTLNKHVHYGATVLITLKEDQGTDKRVVGTVKDVLTKKNKHPRGLKVRLKDGQIGRVQSIISNNIIG